MSPIRRAGMAVGGRGGSAPGWAAGSVWRSYTTTHEASAAATVAGWIINPTESGPMTACCGVPGTFVPR